MNDSTHEVITPPRRLRDKVQTTPPSNIREALERAESLVDQRRSRFDLAVEAGAQMRELQARFAAVEDGREPCEPHLKAMYEIVHDLRGQGATFGYPLVTRIGNTFCRLLEIRTAPDRRDLDRIRAHIDALVMVVSKNLRGEHPAGTELVAGLERLLANAERG